MTKKYWITLAFSIGFIFHISSSFSQEVQKFHVFKLENKIGTEEVSSSNKADGNTTHIVIRTMDRGQALLLNSSLNASSSKLKLVSSGHTSRFKQERLDTVIAVNGGFPLGNNGSIKMREMLIAYWLKAGRPKLVKSALDGTDISIHELNQPTTSSNHKELRVFLINHGLDEIFWTDMEGNGVFMTTNDTEGDKREVVADKYLPQFGTLNQQSTQYLLQAYKESSSTVGKPYAAIAIIGGNIVDVALGGEMQKNTMILIINGKIAYVGSINKSLIPPAAHVIDASNKFLIPGLWDMHAHVFHPSYLQKALLSGVTTIRDMGNEFDLLLQLKDMADQSAIPTPNLYAAGLLDGRSPATLGTMLATNPKEIKANVKRYHEAGFTQIKVYSSVSKKNFDLIVAEAKRYQMQVVGHLPTGYTLGYFINNGLNSLSHVHSFMNNIKWSSGDLVAANKTFLDNMVAKHTYLDPTLNVYRLTGDNKIGFYFRLVKMFSDYGIPIVAGTDNEGTISEEIQSYVQLGLTPLEAIRSATIVPATLMGLAKDRGSIEKGKAGELLILEDNPLLNISTLNKIRTIVLGEFVIYN